MRLLQRHARPGAAPSRFDVLFVTGFLILLFLLFIPLSFLIPSSSGLATVTMPILVPLAGFAGVLIGSYYNMVRFDVGLMYGIKGFSAAVVGGLGNFHGAILGGLILGLVETLASAYVPQGMAYKDVYAFLIVVFFLVFRPSGILAEKQHDKV